MSTWVVAGGGKFISFEGGEGAGKSTVIASLGAELTRRGRSVLVTREPGAGAFGAAIRSLLLDQGDLVDRSELFLFLADRANHCSQIIRPALTRGDVVLCDRHADSTLVYQGFVRGLDEAFVRRANTFATDGVKPDLTFLLDIDPVVGLARRRDMNRLDREPVEFHRKVREGFLRLAREEPERWRIIDADQPEDQVLSCVLGELAPS